ncbi:MAG TPA: class IV lanthionine synthetase LanL [Actinoallomurus sp.]
MPAARLASLPAPPASDDPARFDEIVRAGLPRVGWRIQRAGVWTHVAPRDAVLPDQGWKVHLSAVPSSAALVLERATPLLAEAGCSFKFAASPAEVARLTGRHADRGSAGKFLTVYPPDDSVLPDLVRALDDATAGLDGPRILSDRPCRPGSLVHFRYGGFVRRLRLAANGVYEAVVAGPDGTWVTDRRDAWFSPPPWAPPNPFAEPPAAPAPVPGGVLIDDRFLLRGAIRHANKGGVFRATDQHTGEQVVVKQARRHVEVRSDGGDVRDLLRNEARMLGRLAATGLVPRVHALIDLPEHTFLVVQALDGVSLGVHLQRLHRGGAADPDAVRRTASSLVDLVAAVHREDVVIRDLTPANVMVLPGGELRLIDLELAGLAGQDAVPGGSPGYAAPEQWTERRTCPAVDLHSLGAILFALVTGAEPVLADDDERSAHDRIAGWLDRAARDLPLAAELGPLILELTGRDHGRRPSLARVREALRASEPAARSTAPRADDADRLLDDGLTYLIGSGGGTDPDGIAEPGTARWWPADAFGATTDPCNVYYGAAGIVAVLAMACRHRPDPALLAATARAARWLERSAAREPVTLPGLHFGRSGTYWALLEAAIALDDAAMVSRVTDAAELLPASGPVPDVTHGIAGTGLTALRFWRHTGRDSFRRTAEECADALLAAAVHGPDGVRWPVPPQPPHLPAGATHHGFAHGTAGIAAFLLDVATVTGRDDRLATARQAGRTLCAATLWGHDGAARWSAGPGDHVPLTGWCSGAAGVGAFLLRLWRATGETDFRLAAEGAAAAVRHDIWQSRPVHCHGTAGSIDHLMDMAEATGDDRYRAWADEAVSALAARAVVRDGLLLTPDHSGIDVLPGWGVGVAGVVAALLRPHGAAALFMPPLDPAEPLVATATPRTCGAVPH